MRHNVWALRRILIAFAFVCSLTSIHFSTKPQWTNDSNSDERAQGPMQQVTRTDIKVQRRNNVTLNPSVEKQEPLGNDRVALNTALTVSISTDATVSPLFPLDSFRAKYAPIIPRSITGEPPSKERPVRIRALLFDHQKKHISFRDGDTWAISDEVLNICMDGWERSPYFDFVKATVIPDFHEKPDYVLRERQDIVWVVDMRRILKTQKYTVWEQLLDTANKTLQWQKQQHGNDVITTYLKVVLMDYRDRSMNPSHCKKEIVQLIDLLGKGNVASVKQQIVRKRLWNETSNFPDPGFIWDSSKDEVCFGRPTLRVPYTVRSDYAEAVQETYHQFLAATEQDSSSSNSASLLLPPDTVRTRTDVAHFWTFKKLGSNAAVLRNAVTSLVVSLNGTTPFGSSLKPLTVIGAAVSMRNAIGRTNVSKEYLESLLTTKIVVVAQRDNWEDHYRLFEAISCGALVMTDPMLSLPDELVDGENIIVYRSLDHLRKLVLYYLDPAHNDERLRIARAGWKLAMGRHRTYHWMEELFFGQRISA
jgi:hypothetical protein